MQTFSFFSSHKCDSSQSQLNYELCATNIFLSFCLVKGILQTQKRGNEIQFKFQIMFDFLVKRFYAIKSWFSLVIWRNVVAFSFAFSYTKMCRDFYPLTKFKRRKKVHDEKGWQKLEKFTEKSPHNKISDYLLRLNVWNLSKYQMCVV
jgi:hypothetical protein